VYEHVDSTSESLLWITDVVAWCFARPNLQREETGARLAESALVQVEGPKMVLEVHV
jgi:hypothetical protein